MFLSWARGTFNIQTAQFRGDHLASPLLFCRGRFLVSTVRWSKSGSEWQNGKVFLSRHVKEDLYRPFCVKKHDSHHYYSALSINVRYIWLSILIHSLSERFLYEFLFLTSSFQGPLILFSLCFRFAALTRVLLHFRAQVISACPLTSTSWAKQRVSSVLVRLSVHNMNNVAWMELQLWKHKAVAMTLIALESSKKKKKILEKELFSFSFLFLFFSPHRYCSLLSLLQPDSLQPLPAGRKQDVLCSYWMLKDLQKHVLIKGEN